MLSPFLLRRSSLHNRRRCDKMSIRQRTAPVKAADGLLDKLEFGELFKMLYFYKGDLLCMKKTCMNCKKYHAVLLSNDGSFHIHDWCEQWKTELNAYALADKMGYECPFNSDLETGDAFCYMFEAADTPSYPDEWYDKNKAENENNLKNRNN